MADREGSSGKAPHLAFSEEQQLGMFESFGAVLAAFTKKIVESFGDEGRRAIVEASVEAFKWVGQQGVDRAGIKEKGIYALAKYAYPTSGPSEMSDIGAYRLEPYRLDDNNFAIKVTHCPYMYIWKALGIPEQCSLLTQSDTGVGMIFDPTLRMTLEKCMSTGDEYCVYAWKRYKNPEFDLKTRSWKEKDEKRPTKI
jgi:hypothetical protein